MSKKDTLAPYNWAREEMKKGIQELAGLKNNNPRIVWYHSHTTLRATDDETPWCSAFMCAAAESNGFASTRSAAAKSWENYGEAGTGKKGEIAVFKRASAGNPNARHVAFVDVDVKDTDTMIVCLGGNQSNRVCVSKYKRSELVCFRKFVD
jgi:uncharacterized protein (TIGR02594 family)